MAAAGISGGFLVIPAIDIIDGQCVRLIQGDYAKRTVYSNDPAENAVAWCDQGARLLHLVDLDGAKMGAPANLATVKRITEAIDIPVELGGGIRSLAAAESAAAAGAARVIIGTAALENPEMVDELLAKLGAEKVVIGIDARDGKVSTHGWLRQSDASAAALAADFAARGVRRFIFTDISTDGMLAGPNLAAMETICAAVPPDVQIIASGGVSAPEHITALRGLRRPNLEGAIVGKALYEGITTFADLKQAAESVGG